MKSLKKFVDERVSDRVPKESIPIYQGRHTSKFESPWWTTDLDEAVRYAHKAGNSKGTLNIAGSRDLTGNSLNEIVSGVLDPIEHAEITQRILNPISSSNYAAPGYAKARDSIELEKLNSYILKKLGSQSSRTPNIWGSLSKQLAPGIVGAIFDPFSEELNPNELDSVSKLLENAKPLKPKTGYDLLK